MTDDLSAGLVMIIVVIALAVFLASLVWRLYQGDAEDYDPTRRLAARRPVRARSPRDAGRPNSDI